MLKALDLFCKGGGASEGIARHFNVQGVDIEPQPNYRHPFIQGDALTLDIGWLRQFSFIWASPPCLAHCAYKRRGESHVPPAVDLIPKTRELLEEAGVPYVIENVAGARKKLIDPVMLCGSSFGLDIRRHRYFETSGFTIPPLACDHAWQTPRFPCATNRTNLRSTVEVGVYRIKMDVQYRAMGGLEWLTRSELSAAIPPVFAERISRAAMLAVQ